jgi:hypothetical protein
MSYVVPTRGRRRQLAICLVLGVSTLPATLGRSFAAGAAVLRVNGQGCVIPRVASPSTAAFAAETGAPMAWPYTVLIKNASVQVFDPAIGWVYGLDSEVRTQPGPDLLEGFELNGGRVHEGPTIGLGGGFSESLNLANGSLWVGGSIAKGNEPPGPELCQVNPVTLHLVRHVSLPAPKPGDRVGLATVVSPGPHDTVWVGYGDTLVHIDARTGAIASTETVATGSISSLATDPEDHLLYVSLSYPTIEGKMVDAAVEERTAMGGKLLLTTSATSPVTYSVSGGGVTALPGGVADSFRTGMRGATELLSAAGLTPITPPGLSATSGSSDEPPGDVFSWPMSDSTLYAAGSLWIQNQWGVLACVNPVTGAVFASEQPPQPGGASMKLLGAQPASHQLLAALGDEVISIRAPTACWH